MKYRVTLTQYVPMTTKVVVEAKDEDEAAKLAIDEAGPLKTADWTPLCHAGPEEMDIEDIEEVL